MFAITLRIDMKLSRERVLEVLKRRKAAGLPCSVSLLATEIGCHPNTVSNALRDLKATGKLRVIRGGRRVPSVYEFPDSP